MTGVCTGLIRRLEIKEPMASMIYPLKFDPIFQPRIWGGTRLKTLLGKPIPKIMRKSPVGESWELADLPPGSVKADSIGAAADGSLSSRISNGALAGQTLHQVLADYKSAFLPDSAGEHFPLLVKFLDAGEDLSVQVHPTANYAASHEGAHLKTEAWYILDAVPGARLFKGLMPGVGRRQFVDAISTGKVAGLLRSYPARVGDCHFLPSGQIHALGAGILAAEVQTPSDTTFRIFDWNRVGPDGKPRALQIAEATEVINFNQPPAEALPPGRRIRQFDDVRWTNLVDCDYFHLSRADVAEGSVPLPSPLRRPQAQVWIVLGGQAVLDWHGQHSVAFTTGDTLLVPGCQPAEQGSYLRVVSALSLLVADLPDRGEKKAEA